MGRVEQYRAELRRLTEWEPYLKKNSGLPGTRANLEMVEAVGEEADAERLWWMRSADKDVAWVMQGNLDKARMAALGPAWVARWRRKS